MRTKEIIHDSEVRERILRGVEQAALTIGSTVGPKGCPVVMEVPGKFPRVTKDGVSVAKEIHLDDPYENMGAQLLAEASQKTCDDAGDGTTTASILTYALVKEGFRAIAMGENSVDIKRGMEEGVKIVVEEIIKNSKPIETNEQIKYIAKLSANGDEHIGSLIADAFKEVGKEGLITLVGGKEIKSTLEIQSGLTLPWGYDPGATTCITHRDTETCEYHDASLFFYQDGFPNQKKISALINIISGNKVKSEPAIPVVVFADSFGRDPAMTIINRNNQLAYMAHPTIHDYTRLCPVNLPTITREDRSEEFRKNILEDLCILTGGKLMEREVGDMFATHVGLDYFGHCESVIVSRHQTSIVGARGDMDSITKRRQSLEDELMWIRNQINIDHGYEEHLLNRLQMFMPSAIIRSGGNTDSEISETKDRIEDALHAARAAYEMGIVIGGGMSLINAQRALTVAMKQCRDQNSGRYWGLKCVKEALSEPFNKIMTNAGKDPLVILSNIQRKRIDHRGYNAADDTYCNLLESGIIDPTKVVVKALENASTVAGYLLTTKAMISYKDRDPVPLFSQKMK